MCRTTTDISLYLKNSFVDKLIQLYRYYTIYTYELLLLQPLNTPLIKSASNKYYMSWDQHFMSCINYSYDKTVSEKFGMKCDVGFV